MKKLLICLLSIFTLCTTNVYAKSHHHSNHKPCHHGYYRELPPPPPPVTLVDRVTAVTEAPFVNCDRHFLNTYITTSYYSDGTSYNRFTYDVIDEAGNVIIPTCYSLEHIVSGDKHYFLVNNKYIVDEDEPLLTEVSKFQKIVKLKNNRLLVKQNGKFGIIDYDKNEILPITYRNIKKLNNKILIAKLNGNYGLYSTDGIQILPEELNNVSKLGDTYFKIKKNNRYGVIDTSGKIILPVEYKSVKLKNNKLLYSKDKKYFKEL